MGDKSLLRFRPSLRGRKVALLLLPAILAVGFWLRTREITWGLPEVRPYLGRSMDALHPDESVLVQEAASLHEKGILNIETLRYPPLHAQLTALAEKGFFGTSRLWQRFLIARGISIAAALGSVILLFFIGLRWKPSVALMSGAFLSLSMIAVRESHWANPEALSAFWALAAFWLLVRIERDPGKSCYILMGIVLALGIASKYFAVLFIHLPILALFLDSGFRSLLAIPGNRRAAFRFAILKIIPAYASFGIAIFFLLGIYVIRNPQMFIQAFQTHSLWAAHNGLFGIFPDPASIPTYFASILPIALAPPVYVLAMAGIILSLVQRRRLEMVLMVGLLPFGVFLELLRYHPLRFCLCLVPVLCLFAAIFFDWIFSRGSRSLSALAVVLLIAVLAYSGLYSLAFVNVLRPQEDARILASQWIAAHAPAPQQVAVLGVDLTSNSFGFIHYDGMDRLTGKPLDIASNPPEWIVLPKHVAHIFDQHERLTATGYRYSASDWAPMNAPSAVTFKLYREWLLKQAYRPAAEFSGAPRIGLLRLYTAPLQFDLALTNLEVGIFQQR